MLLPQKIALARRAAFGLAVAVTALIVASAFEASPLASGQSRTRPKGWSAASHGQRARPDYDAVFGMTIVHELRLTIEPEQFRAMQADLKSVLPQGLPGERRGGPGGAGGGHGPMPDFAAFQAACRDKTDGAACSANGTDGQCRAMRGPDLLCMPAGMGPFPGRGAMPSLTTRDPKYVPATLAYDGREWPHIGVRYKGNSSLMAGSGLRSKLPFRLDFDKYEKEFPETRDQRFYGFGALTFSSNVGDDSQLREVLATEILRDRGIAAARAAFSRVFVDVGGGPEYWGLYSMIEDPSDGGMLTAQFGGGGGNLYKPEGPGADWTVFDRRGFVKKTNVKNPDYADVAAAVEALHASTDNRAAWRAGLEATFDVDLFLRWLATNTLIDNWDAYGVMAHNYYLYADPGAQGRLRWIPWDHNFAFGAAPAFGGRGFPGGERGSGVPPALRGGPGAPPRMPFGGGGDVLHNNASESWPLIQRLLADEVYAARYRTFLRSSMEGLSAEAAFAARARELHALVAASVVGPGGERPGATTVSSREAFEASVDGANGLVEAMRRRRAAIGTAVGAEPAHGGR